MKRLLFALLFFFSPGIHAQAARNGGIPIALRYAATEANSPPGTCGCFWLMGAGVDAALPVTHGFSLAFDLAGDTTKQVPATARGLSVITLLAGPRYSLPASRFATVNMQALFGVARGFNADFIVAAGTHTDTASVFGMSLGASVDVPVTRSLAVRVIQAEYLQTNLPNGQDNRQKNLRVGAGIVFRVHVPSRH